MKPYNIPCLALSTTSVELCLMVAAQKAQSPSYEECFKVLVGHDGQSTAICSVRTAPRLHHFWFLHAGVQTHSTVMYTHLLFCMRKLVCTKGWKLQVLHWRYVWAQIWGPETFSHHLNVAKSDYRPELNKAFSCADPEHSSDSQVPERNMGTANGCPRLIQPRGTRWVQQVRLHCHWHLLSVLFSIQSWSFSSAVLQEFKGFSFFKKIKGTCTTSHVISVWNPRTSKRAMHKWLPTTAKAPTGEPS